MATCPEIEPLITPVVDEDATPGQRAAVQAHLQECAGCRRRATEETTVRRVLRDRASALHVEAPASLRARCRPVRESRWRILVHPMPAWAAAAALILILAGVFYGIGRGSTAFAAELALDHVKCFALFGKTSGPAEPATIAERMKASYGWTISVPAASAALGLQLVGGRRCLSIDGRVAHILYRHAGRPLSLFVVPGTTRPAEQLAVMGHEAIIWSRGGSTFVVLAREPRQDVTQVASYFRDVVH